MGRRTEIDKLDISNYGKLIRILMLMESNNHLSSSSAGLKEKSKNIKEAMRLLQSILTLTDEQTEEMYQLFLEENA